MKVIFLDHQGVMYLKKHVSPGKLDDFDKNAVNVLNFILKETDAEIVISSDWKYWTSFNNMCKFYSDQGIIKTPIGVTPTKENRSDEILEWINKNPISNWVAVDDIDLDINNFVLTDPNYGMNGIGIKEKIISLLNNI